MQLDYAVDEILALIYSGSVGLNFMGYFVG